MRRAVAVLYRTLSLGDKKAAKKEEALGHRYTGIITYDTLRAMGTRHGESFENRPSQGVFFVTPLFSMPPRHFSLEDPRGLVLFGGELESIGGTDRLHLADVFLFAH